ncbi:P2Y purinoceptor 4-like [Saccostrea echinata]|uniref:P2Y purinoceptor 4-like n=1 Tax=Saccostrea echinata TaxID=191078 RepID=UPI002A82E6D9|nr:P2Y purinoceptor 4-like [Saccostrea echinata]
MFKCFAAIIEHHIRPTNSTGLADLNLEVVKWNAVPIAILGVIFLIGLPANSIMLHIFRTAFKRTAYRLVSMWLASLGLINVTVIVPLTVWLFLWEIDHPSEIQCKVGAFLSSSLILFCHLVLFVIAIERYRKVFYPFMWQIEQKELNFYHVILLLVATAVASPHAIFVGHRTVPTGIQGLNATFCFISDSYIDSSVPTVYYIILNILAFTVTMFIITMYGRIIHVIRHYKKQAQRNDVYPEYDQNNPVCFSSATRLLETRRTTITLFASTLTFIMTTFPSNVTAMLLLFKTDLFCFAEKTLSIVIRVAVCTLLLNSVINPCIYFFADIHFRSEVKQLCSRIKSNNPRQRF